jgi:hypothetical protein
LAWFADLDDSRRGAGLNRDRGSRWGIRGRLDGARGRGVRKQDITCPKLEATLFGSFPLPLP